MGKCLRVPRTLIDIGIRINEALRPKSYAISIKVEIFVFRNFQEASSIFHYVQDWNRERVRMCLVFQNIKRMETSQPLKQEAFRTWKVEDLRPGPQHLRDTE